MKNKKAIVLGAGGFIGSHLVKRLKQEDYWVRGVDLKKPDFSETVADDFIVGDLKDTHLVRDVLMKDAEVYQLAADMGGAGYIFSGENDANVMHNSAMINLNVANEGLKIGVKLIFYSSSACMYPAYNQEDPNNPMCAEDTAYPAAPDSEYGWEKLFSERLYKAFERNYKLPVRIARFHNIFGPEGTWQGGKEKAPAALCRKVIETPEGGNIEIWGNGQQTRSFLYIDECVEGVRRLVNSDFIEPVNIGSEEMISINDFAEMIIRISGKNIGCTNLFGDAFKKKYGYPCPLGVKGRNSDNTLFKKAVGWAPSQLLETGIAKTYHWIYQQYALEKEKRTV